MSLSEARARVKGRIWQAVAQSGVDLTPLGQEAADNLINAVTDGVLQELDSLLGEAESPAAGPEAAAPAPPDGEQLLWEGRPFMKLGIHYQITDERVRIVSGLMGKEREDVELIRVQDIDQTQSLSERMLNIGDIHIRSHDPSSPQVTLQNVAEPQQVHEILRRAVLEARKRHGLNYREEM